ncbi:MAG TPA: hypothetical protein VEL51_03800 [Vicinamibacterales bacterium]|nr:hypothetical protein [Vicinamibacterales bacterium]
MQILLRFAGALLLLAAVSARSAAHDPITTKVTFGREVRAILAARCVTCHSARGSAPMPLTTYDEVRPWARAIKEQVLARRMPKWDAARGFGAFANDPTPTPLESALIVSWVDGGLPRGADTSPVRATSGFIRQSDQLVSIPAAGNAGSTSAGAGWISGWSFEPGDPLVSSATIGSSAGPIGTWVGGDAPVVLPPGSAIQVGGRIRVEVRRRAAADFESPFTPRASLLRLRIESGEPTEAVWIEQVACGAARNRAGALLAVRPILAAGASARLWVQRPGAPAAIVGWFRDFDPGFARAYWLARPQDLPLDARLQSDAPCSLDLTLTARR